MVRTSSMHGQGSSGLHQPPPWSVLDMQEAIQGDQSPHGVPSGYKVGVRPSGNFGQTQHWAPRRDFSRALIGSPLTTHPQRLGSQPLSVAPGIPELAPTVPKHPLRSSLPDDSADHCPCCLSWFRKPDMTDETQFPWDLSSSRYFSLLASTVTYAFLPAMLVL